MDQPYARLILFWKALEKRREQPRAKRPTIEGVSEGKFFHVCSARQCTEVARWAVIWRNPKIHEAKEKTWMACEGHKEFLTRFVALRGFPHRVVPASDIPAPDGPSAKPVDPRSLTPEERASLGE